MRRKMIISGTSIQKITDSFVNGTNGPIQQIRNLILIGTNTLDTMFGKLIFCKVWASILIKLLAVLEIFLDQLLEDFLKYFSEDFSKLTIKSIFAYLISLKLLFICIDIRLNKYYFYHINKFFEDIFSFNYHFLFSM